MATTEQARDTGMIVDQETGYVTVMGVEFGVGFLSMLVIAAQEGDTLRLELMDDGTLTAERVD